MTVGNLQADLKTMENDTVKIAKNTAWLKNLKKDYYLYESMKVMEEMEK